MENFYGNRVAEIQAEQELEELKRLYMKNELELIEDLENNGYKRVRIASDGNCMFSALGKIL